MRINNLIFISFSLFIMVWGCSHEVDSQYLVFDNDSPIEINLENKSYTIINGVGNIDKVDCFNDKMAIISSNRLLLVGLDGKSSRFISNVGRANEEYLSIWDAGFLNDGKVYLYDLNGKKVMYFDSKGDYLYSKSLVRDPSKNAFQIFIQDKYSNYIARCSYNGMDGYPELALYDDTFSFIKYIDEDISLNSGLLLGYPFGKSSSKSILYKRNFYNEIYEIILDTAIVKYNIDFGKYTYKRRASEGDYEIVASLQNTKKDYAIIYSDLEEIENKYFAFSFLSPNARRLAIYDMKTDTCYVASFRCRDDETLAYVRTFESVVYALTQTMNGLTRLYAIPLSEIQ